MSIIANLQQNLDEILPYFDLSEEELSKSYAPGKWTVKQLLHHLADAETVLYERIRRAIAKPGQIVWGFDQDAWADNLEYGSIPLEMNKAILISVRIGIIYFAGQYYMTKGDNFYIHSETGNRLLHEEFDKVVWHAEHHLSQIKTALTT